MRNTFIILLLSIVLSSCDKLLIGDDSEIDDIECFNLFWTNYDLHYPSFLIKNIDWDSVRNIELLQIKTHGLFYVLNDIGKILNDGHYGVITNFGKNIWSPYPWTNRATNSPINIGKYIALQKYSGNSIQYGSYNNIGYICIKSFGMDNQTYNQASMIISSQFKEMDGVIIDIRDNPGGNIANGDLIAGLFTDKKILTFKLKYRNGPKHSDFRSDLEHYIYPSSDLYITKPVAVLTNRISASASEMFCLNMRMITNAFIVGDTTRGTITDNIYQELPNGWIYRLPTAYAITPNNEIFEGKGIPPNYPIWISKQDSILGKDLIFEKAVEIINSKKISR